MSTTAAWFALGFFFCVPVGIAIADGIRRRDAALADRIGEIAELVFWFFVGLGIAIVIRVAMQGGLK